MLTEPIMHECVFKLLNNKDEESLECLCKLLRTIGKELDSDKAKVSTCVKIFSQDVFFRRYNCSLTCELQFMTKQQY